MSSRDFRLALIRFANELTRKEALEVAKMHGLDGSTQDKISRNDPGMTLVEALEQRMILHQDENAVDKFCKDLYEIRLDHLVEHFKKVFPNLTARPLPKPARVPPMPNQSESGNVVSGTSDQVGAHHVREDVPEDVVSTDVPDRALSELSNFIGQEWKQIAIESLNLKSYQIAEIEEDNKKFRDKIFAMFVMWRKRNAGNASTATLLEILQGRSDLEVEALEALREYL